MQTVPKVPVRISRFTIYILTFILTLHFTPSTYIDSSFLSQFVGENQVGYIYTSASFLAVIAFALMGKFLRKIGNFRAFSVVIVLEFIALLTLTLSGNPNLLIAAYILGSIMRTLAFFHMDIFLESISKDNETGGVRGVYLTALNTAFIIGPIIASLLLTDHDFWKIYAWGTLMLLPVLYINFRYLSKFKDSDYKEVNLYKTFKKILIDPILSQSFMINSILRFFFAWMIIYTPIYLNQHIGFSLSETTLIIGIALIPFVILEAPLGRIADRYLGEQEILITGFIITAMAVASISFVESTSFLIWAIILFMTRVGASMIEVMSETYFFKKINSSDLDIISCFRVSRPIVYVFAPLFASILLTFIDIKYLFLVLSAVVLYGIRYSLNIKDTL